MAKKQHALFALLCISALDPNLTHILFAESVFEGVTSADSHIFKCIFISSRVFLWRIFFSRCVSLVVKTMQQETVHYHCFQLVKVKITSE